MSAKTPRLHRTHRLKFITAHPRFLSQDGPLFRLAMRKYTGNEEHKLDAAFASLYPSAFVNIEHLGGTAFALDMYNPERPTATFTETTLLWHLARMREIILKRRHLDLPADCSAWPLLEDIAYHIDAALAPGSWEHSEVMRILALSRVQR